MEVSLNLIEDFAKLKESFTCPKCNRLLNSSLLASTCEHVQCGTCRKSSENKCYRCKNPLGSADLRRDDFTASVLASIRNIERIFEAVDGGSSETNSVAVPNYEIVVPKVAMKRNHKGETLLHLACKKGDLGEVKKLVTMGVDLNMTDYANWAPIHEAVERNHKACVEYLLSNGALANVPGENYVTPLHKAVSSRKTDIARLLIRYDANVDAVDYSGLKPLETAGDHSLADIRGDYEITAQVFVSAETVVYAKKVSKQDTLQLTMAKATVATRNEFLTKDVVTHYVVADGSDELDSDILVCLLKGIFIVDKDWIADYAKTQDKKSLSIVKTYEKADRLAVTNRLLKNPKLFDGMSFYISGHVKPKKVLNLKLKKEDLVALIKTGGGKILNRPPIVKTSQNESLLYPFHAANTSLVVCDSFVIYHESERPELMYKMREVKHRSSRWLIECALNFKIIDE